MDLRKELYYYKDNKKKIVNLEEKIIYLRTKAEKITPTFSDDGPVGSFNNDSKVERNVLKILELQNEIDLLKVRVSWVDDFMKSLKPYQRYIVRSCVINHIPYEVIAKREKTTPQNISKIIHKVL